MVGESGCGKSTTGRLLTRLLEPTAGADHLRGAGHHPSLGGGAMRPLRRDIQMIFQDPYSSLNPRHTVGKIVGAPFRLQGVTPARRGEAGGPGACSSSSGSTRSTTTATRTSSPAASGSASASPARWRCEPRADRGRRAGLRARRLDPGPGDQPAARTCRTELDLTYVMIAHDLSVVRHVSDRVAVMYLGKIVELADRDDLYEHPMHPYTVALMSAVPSPDTRRRQSASGSGCRATCPADQPAAGVPVPHPAAGRRRRSARPRSRRWCELTPRPPGGLPLPGERPRRTPRLPPPPPP